MYEASTATVLEDLIGTLEEAREGYSLAAEKLAGDGYPEIARRMVELSTQRTRLRAELRMIGLTNGVEFGEISPEGSSPEGGWPAIMDVSMPDVLGSVLAAAQSGEHHAVGEYERALRRDDLPEDLRPVIEAQADKVRAAQDELEALRDQAR
jgi:uncharacterized protein (TIGR02284 family)